MEKPLEDVDMSVRTYWILKRNGVDTEEQLRAKSEQELTSMQFMTMRAMKEIQTVIGTNWEY